LSRLLADLMRRHLLIILLLWLVVGAVFSSVLQAEFVAWDDEALVPANTFIQGLDAARLKWMFTNVSYAMRYKPLSWLTSALIYTGAGMNPRAFHLANLAFHCLNAALLYALICQLLLLWRPAGVGREGQGRAVSYCAALGALVWAVHPLRVEAVARVTDLAYCQALLFLLISLHCYLRASAEPQPASGRGFYWAAVGAFALSMLSYPFAFAYAIVLVVLDAYPLRRFGQGRGWWRDAVARRIWLEKVPFVLLGGLVLVTLFGRMTTTGSWVQFQPLPGLTPLGKGMQAAYIWAYYLWKPWAPLHLSPVYTTLVSFNPLSVPFLMSATLVIGLTALLVWKRRQWPWALALWVCHLVLLAAALGLSEHPHFPGDRYSYVPGILWSVLLAGALLKLWPRRALFGCGAGVLLVLAVGLGVMSACQATIWRDSVSLFQYTLTRLGEDPYRGDIYWRLGRVYLRQQKLEEAAAQCRLSLAIEPKVPAHFFLAQALQAQGHFDEALEHYNAVLRSQPDAEIHAALAGLFEQRGQIQQAIEHYREALQLPPVLWTVRNNLAWILATTPDPAKRDGKEAVQLAEQACALTGQREPMVLGTLAAAYAEAGRFAEAVETAKKAAGLAEEAKEVELASRNGQLLELYRARQPYHERGITP
jgi:protein O-mannosyl-transferase